VGGGPGFEASWRSGYEQVAMALREDRTRS